MAKDPAAQSLGSRGGQKTLKKKGRKFFSSIAKKRHAANRKKKAGEGYTPTEF